MKNVDNK